MNKVEYVEFNKLLNEARRLVRVASANVQKASTLCHDFDKSKPLNILYKELRASNILLDYYTGAIKQLPKDGYEVITPQSIRIYLVSNPDHYYRED